MKLIIVESPTKARTISGFVPKGIKVLSSYGHIRDLPKSTLGIDEESFEPKYIIPTRARKTVNELKKEAKKADEIILATDEDREGEAIAWHLMQALDLKKADRIVFHEITKKAIEEALSGPRKIDLKLVDAQQARRILDRLVGYKLSPFLWKKLYRGLSAGRVQSVAVRVIVEREREIQSFKPEEYWTLTALLKKENSEEKFEAHLFKKDGETLDKFAIKDEGEAKKTLKDLEKKDWVVGSVEKKEVTKNPPVPFTTSTLQQEAFRRMGFTAKQTMLLAQQLYEGMELGEGASSGLITYMRTDSLNVSEEALAQAKDFLETEVGKNYALASPRRFKTKTKGAQEAHEAIRPTDPKRTPDSIKDFLNARQLKLYSLIWKRFIASQMPAAIFNAKTVDIEADNYIFRATGQTMKFDGFLKIYPLKFSEAELPELSAKEKLELLKLEPGQHFTEPPPRYTEASLVKILEKNGIGRPSTYAPIISTIQERNYVLRDDKKRLAPTEVGFTVNDMLVQNFPEIVDIQFTAKMEQELDEIADGDIPWKNVIKGFYGPFLKNLTEKYEKVEKQDFQETTDEKCEKCGKPMVIKRGRFGRFMACSGFPDCKSTKPLPPVSLNLKCLKCHEGEIVERQTKRGKMFYGCSLWPKCDFALWLKPTGDTCPECSSPLVYVKDKIKCSSKSCTFEGKELKPKV
ncbi:DNA topoisomerase I [Candidatus Giovannonibacteria bacterium RIFCSPLOWO2_01_FULL_46_13]|uniref:DNA topoisomerase 1 n=1 Tax=Candidatus Giovannonibacteria bacterium RIFCSPLOWO2_01_FULL_46_13 TaxID=1798352 RepID=A0A1F5X3T3_9BACT|nr:MAG: DNA topoisomerase I [Candidatus Giovannonibacteria bacterium RIFCSPLOWO2_01_FULL_46_13]